MKTPVMIALLLAVLAASAHAAAASTLSQVCPAAPVYSYVDIVADPDGGAIDTFVYNITGNYDKNPIPQALVYRINLTQGSQADDLCYGVTDPLASATPGKAHFPYDPKFEGCLDNWFIFCPNGDVSAPSLREMCLNGTGLPQHKISSDPIPRCDGKSTPPLPQNRHLLSHNEFYYCNYNPADLAPLCWPLMLIFSLLVAASYAAGRNPFLAFDFSAPRMNRGRAYTTRAQQKSFDVMSISYGINAVSTFAAKTGALGKNNKDFSLIGAVSKTIGGTVAKLFKTDKKGNEKAKDATLQANPKEKKEPKHLESGDGKVNKVGTVVQNSKGTGSKRNETQDKQQKQNKKDLKKAESGRKTISGSSTVGYMAPNLLMAILDLLGIKSIKRSDAEQKHVDGLAKEMEGKGYFEAMWAAMTYRFKNFNTRDWGFLLFRAIMETVMKMTGRGSMSKGLTNAIMLAYFIDQPEKLPFGLNFLSEPIAHLKTWVETLGIKENQLLENGWVCIDKKDNVWARKLEDGKWEIFEKNTRYCVWEKSDGSWTLYNGKEYVDWKAGDDFVARGLDPTKYISDSNGYNTLKNEVNDTAAARLMFLAVLYVDGKWKAEGVTGERYTDLQNENLKLIDAQNQFDLAIRNMIHIGNEDYNDKRLAEKTSNAFADLENGFTGKGEKLDADGKELFDKARGIIKDHLPMSLNDISADNQRLYAILDKAIISTSEDGKIRMLQSDLKGTLTESQVADKSFAANKNGYVNVEYSKLTLGQKQAYIDGLIQTGKAQDMLEKVDHLLGVNEKFAKYESITRIIDARSLAHENLQRSMDAVSMWSEEKSEDNLKNLRDSERNYQLSEAALKSAIVYSQIEEIKKELFDGIAETGSFSKSDRKAELEKINEKLDDLTGQNRETQKWYEDTAKRILEDKKVDINEYQDLTEKQKDYLVLQIKKTAYEDSKESGTKIDIKGTKEGIESAVNSAGAQYKIDQTLAGLVANWKGPEEDLKLLLGNGLQTSNPDHLAWLNQLYSLDLGAIGSGYVVEDAAKQLESSRREVLKAYIDYMNEPGSREKLNTFLAAELICKKDFGGLTNAMEPGVNEAERNRLAENYLHALYLKDRKADLNTFDNEYLTKNANGEEVKKTYGEIIREPYVDVRIPIMNEDKTGFEATAPAPNKLFLEVIEKITLKKAQNDLGEIEKKSESGEYEVSTQHAIGELREAHREFEKKLDGANPEAKMEILLGNRNILSKIGEVNDDLYYYSKAYKQKIEAESKETLLGPAYLTDYDEIVKDAMRNERIYRQINASQLTGEKLREDLKSIRQDVEEIIEKHKILETIGGSDAEKISPYNAAEQKKELREKYEEMSRLPGALGDAWKHGLVKAENKAEYIDATHNAYGPEWKGREIRKWENYQEADVIKTFEQLEKLKGLKDRPK